MQDPGFHIYSRYSQSTNIRAEKVLSQIMGAHALTYSSGLSAAHAAVTFYAPRVIAIRKGYHGVHVSIDLYARGRDVKLIDLDDDYESAMAGITPSNSKGGLLVWVETPLNPTGEARDLVKYARKTHAIPHAHLVVDSTFAPPPLQDPFQQGADMVMHSGTKYFGGHSTCFAVYWRSKARRSGMGCGPTAPTWGAIWAVWRRTSSSAVCAHSVFG